MAKQPPAGILNSPKVDRGTDVSFKQDKVMGDTGFPGGHEPYMIGNPEGLDVLKGAGSLSPKGPDARRSESVGKGPTK